MSDEEYVDDDPDYEADADDDALIADVAAADPASVPPDQGDAGRASVEDH